MKRYLESCYQKLPFALPNAEAQKQLTDRDQTFVENLLKDSADEPTSAKRRNK